MEPGKESEQGLLVRVWGLGNRVEVRMPKDRARSAGIKLSCLLCTLVPSPASADGAAQPSLPEDGALSVQRAVHAEVHHAPGAWAG